MKKLPLSKGFTLIEVMIAVFVFAVGLLGLAGLQLSSLKNNQSAYLRSQAVQYAYDIADRMRANPVGIVNGGALIGGGFDNAAATINAGCRYSVLPLDPTLAAGAAPAGLPAGCTPVQMASHDLYEMVNENAGAQLPGATSVVCIDSTPVDGVPGTTACDGTGNVFAIKVWWVDDRSGTPKRFVTTVAF